MEKKASSIIRYFTLFSEYDVGMTSQSENKTVKNAREPTYWLTDDKKISNQLDFWR